MFGKHKMATFATHFIAGKTIHKERKNPYFVLIHTPEFCQKVLTELGVDRSVDMIINGHILVIVEQGEGPLKDSRQAIIIDRAFSEVYGETVALC